MGGPRVPDLPQQRLRRRHPLGVDREDVQDLVLGHCERHGAAVHRHPGQSLVDGEHEPSGLF